MPTMANVTVKKFDGTTDIIYTAKSQSAGDKSPAVWRVDAVGASVRERPEVRVRTYDSVDGSRRIVKEEYVYPVVKLINGVNTVTGFITKTAESKYPKDASDVDVREAAHQSANLCASVLFKAQQVEGYAGS